MDVIRSGGVIVFPTSGLYGLGVDALNPSAVARVFDIKQRAKDKPLSVIARDTQQLETIVHRVSAAASSIMRRFWPGGVTLVFEAVSTLPPDLTAGKGKIGVRIPKHPVAAALIGASGGPITATSANMSGRSGCADIAKLDTEIAESVELILDAGPLAGGPGSTVVDVTLDPPRILREGAVEGEKLLSVLK